jgi:hypothetical protein
MRTLPLAALLAIVAIAPGCRSNTGQVLVEQEARMFESEVYALEAELDACCQAREALARENEELRRQLAGGGGGGDSYRAPAASSTPSRRSGPLTEAPRLEAPTIELPEPSSTPPDTLIPGNEQPVIPGPGDNGSAYRGRPIELTINRRMTGGLDRDRTGGDEGIMVFVEPRDDEGRLTRVPGAVSVVVMDPSQTGEAARVARWDFQAHEFEKHFKKSAFGEGLLYELKWPKEPPSNRDLMLFVRYISPDGTKLTSDAPLSIRLAGDYPRESNEGLVANEAEPSNESARGDLDSTGDGQRAVQVASQSEPRRERPARALIGPREAKNSRPEWKPYR